MCRMSTAWCRSTNSPRCRSRSRNWRKFSFISTASGSERVVVDGVVGKLLRLGLFSNPGGEGADVTKTMKALVLRKHGTLGDLEVVGDYPRPQVSESHVVIRVRASSFNYHD